MPQMRVVMGVCGGSSYADHPTEMLMGYFAESVDVDAMPHICHTKDFIKMMSASRREICAHCVSRSGGGGVMGYIRKALEKGVSEMYGLGGGSGTIFFRKLAVTGDRLGFFCLF